MENKKQKHYSSLGASLKAHDFEAFITDISKMIETEEIKEHTKRDSEDAPNTIDQLLFHLPLYASKIIENDESSLTDSVTTGELYLKVLEATEILLKLGVDPNAYMENGETAFLRACQTNSPDLLDLLINNKFKRANPNSKDGQTKNGLYYAAMSNCPQTIEYLVNTCKLDINQKNLLLNNQTPIYFAAGHGAELAFDKLVELGAKLDLKDGLGYQPYEMMVLAYDEDSQEEFGATPDEIKKWQPFYEKAQKLTIAEAKDETKKQTFRTKF